MAIAPERTGGLVADNALGLVKAGVDLPSDEVRATVVDGLLSRAAAGDIDPVWGLDLTGLAYPALDKQLAGHLNGGLNQPAQLWWISRLAVAGGCTTLAPALLKIVVVNAWPAWARTAGIDAVAELDDNESLAQLRPLLHLNAVEDPDDEVLAHTIKALHPRLLGTDDLVNALRPRRKTNLFGSYLLLLGDLPRRLPPEELPAMLSWAASHVHGGSEDYGQLLPQLVQRGWNDVDSVAVRAPLAALIASLAKDHSWHNWSRNGPPWSNGEVDRRRQLLIDVAERLDATGWYPLLNLRLVVADDASWLLDQLPALPAAAHAALAACVPHLLEEPSAAVADTILALPVDHPAYGPTNRLRQPLGIDSETANTWRKHRAAGDEGNISDARREERLAQLSAAIDDADQDPTRWWHVVSWLSVDDHGYPESEVLFSLNLTSRPGWLLLDDRQRTGLIDIGLRYLATHELEPSTWSGHKDISVPKALPDWAGLYLLTTLTRYNPERVRELEAAIWDRWSPAIVGAWDYSREDDANLRCELIDLAPSCGRRSVLNAGLDHLDDLQNHKRYLTPQKLYAHLAPDLAPTIADHLVAGRYNGQLGAELLDLLVKHTPQIALQACHQLRNGPDPELAARARRSLPSLDPAHTVDEFASGATADDLIEVVPSLNLAALDAARLAVLARLLLDWLPFAEDPSTPSLDWGADAESETRATRSIALQRLAELGLVSTLDQLAEGRPEADRKVIAWYRQIARSRAADLAYAFPSPKELLDLLAKGDARLVRHNADLLTVVIEQLRELQHEVTHNGAFRDLWNFGVSGDGRPKSEDDISDWIRRQLEQRLGHGTVVDREIQVMRRKPQGIGTRIDLTATSPTATHPPNSARIIVEAKLVNNRTLMTAMEDQLVRQYLLPADLQHGIYLVYWIAPERRPANSKYTGPSNRDELMRQLSAQAADAKRAGLHIEPFLLDITPPSVI
ncbi:MAG: hypothetical protein ACRD0K_15025 [Egibacteraceae bacterium]